MDAWLNALESIDNQWLPPLLLVAGLLLTLYFIYSALNGRGVGRRREANTMTSESRDSLLSETRSLHEVWQGTRDFSTVLRGGLEGSGPLQGWFSHEDKICGEFKNKIANIGEDIEKYPETEIEYLKIVGEIDRAPKPWWVWVLLGVMVAAEAYGFSVLLAGYLNDRGSAAQDTYLASGLSILIAVGALYAAVFIGNQAYKQAYARRVWKDLSGQIRLEVDGPGSTSVDSRMTLGATAADNDADKNQRQATRMANRSEYVKTRAAETKGSADKNLVRPFRIWFWIYVAAVFVFGVFVVTVRTMAINDSHGRELQRMQEIAASETTAPEPASGGVRPDAVTEQNAAASMVVTQESLEQTRSTKIVVTYVYMLLFWVVQAVAVLFTARYGFASAAGPEAYRKIRAFRSRHGGVLAEEYAARINKRVANAKKEALALASATLKNWQLGLQTEYRNGNTDLNENERRVIEAALNGSSHRTYERYVVLTETPMPPQPLAGNPAQVSESTNTAPSVVAHGEVQAPKGDTDIEVEFYQRGSSGDEVVQVGVLQQLKARIAEAELDAASLMVRVAGQPGRYMSYREFMQATRGTPA